MKNKISWRPGRKNADRSESAVQRMSPDIELLRQVSRVHSAIT